MALVNTRPHRLSFLRTSPGFEDDNGDWHIGIDQWSAPVNCMATPAGAANRMTFADGMTTYYSYEISLLPRDIDFIKVGDKVKLTTPDGEIVYEVKGFHRFQLQCKIWV